MHITIAHEKTVPQVMALADRAVDEVFNGLPIGPVEIVERQKKWTGTTMTFGLTAKLGFLRCPVVGTVEVTGRECIVDVNLVGFGRILPNNAQQLIETRWRGLLS